MAVCRVEGVRPITWMEWFPVFAKAWAMERPMPREPPVIRTWVGGEEVGVLHMVGESWDDVV